MLKHTYGLVIGAGLTLLLIAAALVLAPDQAGSHSTVDQRLRIQDALIDLESCTTCHTTPDAAPRLVALTAALDAPDTLDIAPDAEALLYTKSTPDTLKTQVDARLVDLGQRLLDLPETGDAQYASLADDYLSVYATTRTAGGSILLSSLSMLDDLDQLLIDLEHQANPVKLARSAPSAPPCTANAAQTAPLPPPVANAALLAPSLASFRYAGELDTRTVFVPSMSVILVHRRGPPSDGFGVESMLT